MVTEAWVARKFWINKVFIKKVKLVLSLHYTQRENFEWVLRGLFLAAHGRSSKKA